MLLALLLATRAAAEWVEISQQHYRKPVRITTTLDSLTTSQDQLHQNPTKNTYEQDVLWTPARDTYLNQNVQNPIRNTYQYQDLEESTRSTHLIHDVSFKKPVRDYFIDHDGPLYPTRNPHFDQDVKSVRNPFLQDASLHNPTRKIYFDPDVSQSPVVDIHMNKKLESATKDTYFNHSITEHNWNRNMPRPGSGRGNEIVTTVTSFENWNDNTYRLNSEGDDKQVEKKRQDGALNIVRIKDETVSGKIERVPNIGSVKRVQLANTPVKSPILNIKIPERSPDRRKGGHLSDQLDMVTDGHSHEDAVTKNPSNNLKQKLSSTEEMQTTHMDQRKVESPTKEFIVSVSSSQRHSFKHKSDVNSNTVTKDTKSNFRFKQNGVPEITETLDRHKVGSAAKDKQVKHQEEFSTENLQPDFGTKNDNIDSNKQNTKNIENDENQQNHRGSTKYDKTHNEEKISSSEKGENIDPSGEIKVNTMENILKFINVVADTISKNTRRSGANGKITYLNELKQSLLANIKERIDATWPEEDPSPGAAGSRRRSRAASPRGHVEFPSSESALMTISFLTFAVFLIKLVLQVIQTYKHKAMVMAPLMVATAGKKLQGN